jgi:hypothetical protein
MGTTTRMSAACGSCCLRAIAAKNCASDGYTQRASAPGASAVPRGIEDTSRAPESEGCAPGGAGALVVCDDEDESAAPDPNGRNARQDERVVWSTGHASAAGAGFIEP